MIVVLADQQVGSFIAAVAAMGAQRSQGGHQISFLQAGAYNQTMQAVANAFFHKPWICYLTLALPSILFVYCLLMVAHTLFHRTLILIPSACSQSFKSRPYLSPRPWHAFVVHDECAI
jgi:hypothetical protein